MSLNNIYQADVIVDKSLDDYLRKCFLNHLVVYNHSLKILIENPTIKFKDLKLRCYEFIEQKKITEYMSSPLFNELYYQYKKFTEKQIKTTKALNDIHYITFLVNGYDNKCFTVNDNKITIHGADGHIELIDDLPTLTDDKRMLYFNISFSNQESKYHLSIFK